MTEITIREACDLAWSAVEAIMHAGDAEARGADGRSGFADGTDLREGLCAKARAILVDIRDLKAEACGEGIDGAVVRIHHAAATPAHADDEDEDA